MKIYPKNRLDTFKPSSNEICGRPDVFDRNTLTLTFRLLRTRHPSLALEVRNLLSTERVTSVGLNLPLSSDHFYIDMEPQKIGFVVDALTRLGERAFNQKSTSQGQLLLLKTLIQEWMKLAEWIIIQADTASGLHH